MQRLHQHFNQRVRSLSTLFKACALACLALTSSGCGEDGMALGPLVEGNQAATVELALQRLIEAPYTTAYEGVRRVEYSEEVEGVKASVSYEERVVCDGSGNFNLEALSLLTPVESDPVELLLLHNNRSPFYFRYRDFAIRDRDQFLSNYKFVGYGETVDVAGRMCWEFTIIRSNAVEPRYYRVAVDMITGVVLSYEERTQDHFVVSSMQFTSFTTSPNLDGVVMHEPRNFETPLQVDALGQLGFEPVYPSKLPLGYELDLETVVTDSKGWKWLKQTYTDGVESLFFLHRQKGTGGEPFNHSVGQAGDVVRILVTGPLSAAEGSVGKSSVMVVGKVGKTAILQMIDSAF